MPTYRMESTTWQPARVNELLAGHWFKGAALKSRDRQILAIMANNHRVPAATGKRRVALTIVLAPRCRGGDPDAYFKSLLDGLVSCGLLFDDSKECVELDPVQYIRGKGGCVVVLTDI